MVYEHGSRRFREYYIIIWRFRGLLNDDFRTLRHRGLLIIYEYYIVHNCFNPDENLHTHSCTLEKSSSSQVSPRLTSVI